MKQSKLRDKLLRWLGPPSLSLLWQWMEEAGLIVLFKEKPDDNGKEGEVR